MGFEQKTRYRLTWLALALVAMALASAPTASGQMPRSITATGESTGSKVAPEAAFTVEIESGPSGAAFGLAYELPTWPTPSIVLGSPIRITAVQLTGPGVIRPATVHSVPKPRLKIQEACQRGENEFPTSYWVELPADSAAQIELKGRASYPSWPGTSYEVAFSTFEADDPTVPRSPLQAVSVKPLGKRGTHITMWTRGPNNPAGGHRHAVPEIFGRTEPPLRGTRIALRAVRPAQNSGGLVSLSRWAEPSPISVPLGSVLTDERGRFHLPPQPFPYVGRYAISARSPGMGKVVADWNCGPFFTAGA